MRICWNVLEEDELPDIQNVQWPEISVEILALGDDLPRAVEVRNTV